ncbi:hypothetical protein ACIQD3_20900 [Peribacillus loiseleuriae]|uniref:hypothetical protein n=1 Tax=Peribacillus loiseleuriae TaxID=1679170 RepID=UPI0038177C5A
MSKDHKNYQTLFQGYRTQLAAILLLVFGILFFIFVKRDENAKIKFRSGQHLEERAQ